MSCDREKRNKRPSINPACLTTVRHCLSGLLRFLSGNPRRVHQLHFLVPSALTARRSFISFRSLPSRYSRSCLSALCASPSTATSLALWPKRTRWVGGARSTRRGRGENKSFGRSLAYIACERGPRRCSQPYLCFRASAALSHSHLFSATMAFASRVTLGTRPFAPSTAAFLPLCSRPLAVARFPSSTWKTCVVAGTYPGRDEDNRCNKASN